MTIRQTLLKKIYPVLMWISGLKNNRVKNNVQMVQPIVSFYDLTAMAIDGKPLSMAGFRGKKVLLVNTASDCGYTRQYEELEKLQQQFKGKLVVIGFPSNDFKEQEKADDAAIALFCTVNFGVTFPLMKKGVVVKGSHQNDMFKWLSDAAKNGWNNQAPAWNFSKYLVNENGILTHYFNTSTSPLDAVVLKALDDSNTLLTH